MRSEAVISSWYEHGVLSASRFVADVEGQVEKVERQVRRAEKQQEAAEAL